MGIFGKKKEKQDYATEAYGAMCSGDLKKATELLQKGADEGDVICQKMLGDFYLKGTGVPQDKDKAIEFYRKAAAQGDNSSKESLKKLGF